MKTYQRWVTRNGSIAVLHEERVNPVSGQVEYIGEVYDHVQRRWFTQVTWIAQLATYPEYDLIKEDR